MATADGTVLRNRSENELARATGVAGDPRNDKIYGVVIGGGAQVVAALHGFSGDAPRPAL